MKFFRWLNIIGLLAFLGACAPGGIEVHGIPTETALSQPIVTIDSAPSVDEALKAYLDAFEADDYNAMYAKLSKVSQDANTL